MAPHKKVLMVADDGRQVSHPAVFSDRHLEIIQPYLPPGDYELVLDPFAGTGKIHELANKTIGVEIEPEWASLHPDTHVGDATALMYPNGAFDAVACSPTYGNRMADNHNAQDGSIRRSYKHDLGRDLDPNNTGQMHFGRKAGEYETLHRKAWAEAYRVIRPGGRICVNVKNFTRNKKTVDVVGWHIGELTFVGFKPHAKVPVPARGMKFGANRERHPLEWWLVMDRP